jgi:hypothetical protein
MVRTIAIATALLLVASMTTAANALDKPTFGQKFGAKNTTNMRPWTTAHAGSTYKSVNAVKGTNPQRRNTERELMDKMSEGRRNSSKGHGLGLDHTLTNKGR